MPEGVGDQLEELSYGCRLHPRAPMQGDFSPLTQHRHLPFQQASKGRLPSSYNHQDAQQGVGMESMGAKCLSLMDWICKNHVANYLCGRRRGAKRWHGDDAKLSY